LLLLSVVSISVSYSASYQFGGLQSASAGHTIGGGNCLSSPPTCIDQYLTVGLLSRQGSFRMRDFRLATDWNTDVEYEEALDSAEFNWAVAVGPQAPSEPVVCLCDDLWSQAWVDNRYYSCPFDGDPADACDASVGYTCLIDTQFHTTCNPGGTVRYGGVYTYLSSNDFAQLGILAKKRVLAHEMGHAFGLGHHNDSGCLMQQNTSQYGPQPCDIGTANPNASPLDYPCDGSSANYGIRCIYDWWREQHDGSDCLNLSRNHGTDNDVKVVDILLAVRAYNSYAGEPNYNPDADSDSGRDGRVTIADILSVVLQYGKTCNPLT